LIVCWTVGPPQKTTKTREARWLTATCWNAGLARLRRGDAAGAAPLLRCGLDLLRHCPRWGAADAGAMAGVLRAAEAEAGGAAA
jgi:hypothetical protein